jgi:hypothetical protein
MNTPILESGNLSEAKNRARINDGIPDVNMRRERKVMMMYASRPVARSDVIPRKPAILDNIGIAIAWRLGFGDGLQVTGDQEAFLLVTDRNVLDAEDEE